MGCLTQRLSDDKENVAGNCVDNYVRNDSLFNALNNNRWDECVLLMKRPDSQRLVNHHNGWSSLHEACWNNARLDVVQGIVRIEPGLTTKQDFRSHTPLYHACSSASDSVVKFLLDNAPKSASTPNEYGTLPLHVAIKYRRSTAIIKQLLKTYPAAIFSSHSPIEHFLIFWKKDLDKLYPDVDDLIRAHDDTISFVKETFFLLLNFFFRGTDDDVVLHFDKWQPMHDALRLKNVTISRTLIRIIAHHSHMKCATPDSNRNFPLHLTCAQLPEQRPSTIALA